MEAFRNRHSMFAASAVALALLFSSQVTSAGPLRDLIKERRADKQNEPQQDKQQDTALEEDDASGQASLPAGVRVMRDVPYGSDTRQRMDVYLPQQAAAGAPVILMVHGGGWRRGDKAARAVVENKVARWMPKGFIFISVNYRLLPGTAPLEQAEDVARALAAAQAKAAAWGGDPAKFILMGHSAGAHLVALLTASPRIAPELGAKPWLGTVALDSATLDVVQIMNARHFPLHDRAFGTNAAYWKSVSPYHQLATPAVPLLAVCSTQRNDSCPQADRFVGKATSLGIRSQVLGQNLSHKDINQQLGQSGAYTEAVESFMASLDPTVMRLLKER